MKTQNISGQPFQWAVDHSEAGSNFWTYLAISLKKNPDKLNVKNCFDILKINL